MRCNHKGAVSFSVGTGAHHRRQRLRNAAAVLFGIGTALLFMSRLLTVQALGGPSLYARPPVAVGASWRPARALRYFHAPRARNPTHALATDSGGGYDSWSAGPRHAGDSDWGAEWQGQGPRWDWGDRDGGTGRRYEGSFSRGRAHGRRVGFGDWKEWDEAEAEVEKRLKYRFGTQDRQSRAGDSEAPRLPGDAAKDEVDSLLDSGPDPHMTNPMYRRLDTTSMSPAAVAEVLQEYWPDARLATELADVLLVQHQKVDAAMQVLSRMRWEGGHSGPAPGSFVCTSQRTAGGGEMQ